MSDTKIRLVIRALGGMNLLPGGRVQFDDGYYRYRRGKLVRIPDEWVGKPVRFCGEKFERMFENYRHPRKSSWTRKSARRIDHHCCYWEARVPREKVCRAKAKGKPRWASVGRGHPRTWDERNSGQRHRRRVNGREDE